MTITNKAAKRMMDLLRKAQPSRVGPVIWQRVLEFIGGKIQDLDLRVDSDHKISGIPPDTLSEWFRQFCETRGGTSSSAYSRRQRQNIRIAFENAKNAIDPLASEPMDPIRNYPRSIRRGFIDQRAMRDFPLGDLERMRSIYNRCISRHGVFPSHLDEKSIRIDFPDKEKAITLFCLTFGLIVETGITFPGCFSSFCRLKKKHVPMQADGELVIPQNLSETLWLSVSIDDTSRMNLIGLLCHTSRRPKASGIRKRQLRNLDGEEFLLGMEPSEKVIRRLRAGFTNWLRYLASQAGVINELTLEMLVKVAQARLPKIYSAEVIASLSGKIHYHPLPPDQVHLAANDPQVFLRDLDLPRWGDRQTISLSKKPPTPASIKGADNADPVAVNDFEVTPPLEFDETLIDSFHEACQPFLKNWLTPSQASEALSDWGKKILGCEDANEDLPTLLKLRYQQSFISNITMEYPLWKSMNIPLIHQWNMACVAGWFAWRLALGKGRKHGVVNPHTFMGYRRDILALLRSNSQSLISEIGDGEMEEYFSSPESANYSWRSTSRGELTTYRTSTISCWRSIRQFLSTEAGIPLASASLASRSDERRTHYTRLITPEDLETILAITVAKTTQEAYCAYLAILLAHFAGLREGEIVRLRISQIVVKGDATIYIQKGKGRKDRNVDVDDARKDFIEIITEARNLRWVQTKDMNARLLLFPDKSRSGNQADDDYNAKRLSRWVSEAMSQAGLRSKNLIGDLPDLHRLRHAYINRAFLIKEDRLERAVKERFTGPDGYSSKHGVNSLENLRQVSVNAGHSTYPMTLEHYVHCLNWLQMRQLREYQDQLEEQHGFTNWVGRKVFEKILDLNHARAYQILRRSAKLTWRSEGNRKLLGIDKKDFINIALLEIAPLPG